MNDDNEESKLIRY